MPSPVYSEVHTTQKFRLGTVSRSRNGSEFIYLKGVGSLVAGDAVTYDEAGVTALLAANAIGPVAFAQAVVDANTKFGWFQIVGRTECNMVANSADNASLGRETTDGKVGDGFSAGDHIHNCVARSATTTAGKGVAQIRYPFVQDV